MALYGVPFGLFILLTTLLKSGNYYFYDDRLEFKSIGGREVKIPYNIMYVVLRKDQRLKLCISKRDKRKEQPNRLPRLQRIKNWYDDLTIVSLSREEIWSGIDQSKSVMRVLDNYEDIPKALQILREKALSFTEE
jgi:hypothetical protein